MCLTENILKRLRISLILSHVSHEDISNVCRCHVTSAKFIYKLSDNLLVKLLCCHKPRLHVFEASDF